MYLEFTRNCLTQTPNNTHTANVFVSTYIRMLFVQKIRRLVIDSLGFSKTEANGFLILLAIVFLIAIVPRVYFQTYSQELAYNKPSQSLEEWATEMNGSISKKKPVTPTKVKLLPQEYFDPNKTSTDGMILGGLPAFLAKRIVKYRNKGGYFRKVGDLKNIYGMTDSLFFHVKAFVKLPEIAMKTEWEMDTSSYNRGWVNKKVVSLLHMSTTTAKELQGVRGVGPVLSERIIKYRDLLGGYYSADQLKEVWGLTEEVIEEIIDLANFDAKVKSIIVNTDSIKLLAKHPYISYNLARAIVNYRHIHGAYKSLDELLEIKVMNDSLYQKLSPYLSL